jgi:integrase
MSALGQSLAQYVALRRALGAKLGEDAGALAHFVDFLESEGAEFVTSRLALRWAVRPQGVQPATWARRLGQVRGFASFVSATDPRTEIPPVSLLPGRSRRPTPHIFSAGEIRRLMARASRLRSRTGLRGLTHATLIGFLAATGLRPGEALALDEHDVDLRNGVIAVRGTKFGKSRFVPLAPSTCAALAAYARRRREICPVRSTEAFFLSRRGSRLSGVEARRTFARLTRDIGLRSPARPKRVGRVPRLQDLRHSFATKRIVEWYREGADVARKMPALSTYLGHAAVEHTYWYVQAVPELLQLATKRLTEKGGPR